MKCHKCGSENIQAVSKTSGKIKRRGLISTLINLLLVFITCGLWLIVMIIRGESKGKIKSKTAFVYLNCGKEFK